MLAATVKAADRSMSLSLDSAIIKYIKQRNRPTEEDKDLSDLDICAVDVRWDGNCVYRTLSVLLYGDQTQHTALHKSVSHQLASGCAQNRSMPR